MNKSRMLYFILAILVGVFLFIYGGIDDSPGGQMIGILIIIASIAGILKSNKMVIDIELTLNRFGFGKIAENKFQFFCFRFSKWNIPGKQSISFEINWVDKNKIKK